MRPALASGLAVLAVVACSSAPATHPAGVAATTRPPAPVTATPSPPPASPAPTPSRALTLTGAISATAGGAGDRPVCGQNPLGYYVRLALDVDGKPYVLDVNILDFHGPGSYPIPPERVSLHTTGLTSPPSLLAAESGLVTIDPGGRSGSIEARLQGNAAPARLAGGWICS